MSSLTEAEYEARALPELRALIDAFDRLDLDGLDPELSNDILTLDFGAGGRFVVNSHRAARQVWMAADHTAWHFDWDPERSAWVAHKTDDELWSTIERVVGDKLGRAVRLR